MSDEKISILFLCTGNSCRSQMAEAWARQLRGDRIMPYSAGIEKHGMNPFTIKVMEEVGVSMAEQFSKTVDELPVKAFDWVITLCGHAHETCPFFPGRKIHHGFDDPPTLAAEVQTEEEKLACYRRVRDEIREYILTLPASLPA